LQGCHDRGAGLGSSIFDSPLTHVGYLENSYGVQTSSDPFCVATPTAIEFRTPLVGA